jgi:hypothetical protein
MITLFLLLLVGLVFGILILIPLLFGKSRSSGQRSHDSGTLFPGGGGHESWTSQSSDNDHSRAEESSSFSDFSSSDSSSGDSGSSGGGDSGGGGD